MGFEPEEVHVETNFFFRSEALLSYNEIMDLILSKRLSNLIVWLYTVRSGKKHCLTFVPSGRKKSVLAVEIPHAWGGPFWSLCTWALLELLSYVHMYHSLNS